MYLVTGKCLITIGFINLEVNKIIKNSREAKTNMIQKDDFDYLS